MRNLILMAMLLILAGCDKVNESLIDLTKKQTDQANQFVQAARQEVQHLQRLRDIDRTCLTSEKSKLEAEASTWRGLVICSAIILIVLLLWLSHELRQRKIVSHILLAQKNQKEVNNG